MTTPYRPEQHPEEQTEVVTAAEQQAMDSKISLAENAKPDQTSPAPPGSDASELQAQTAKNSYDSTIEADRKVAQAASVGDSVQVSDAADKTALKGQMTDTPHYNQGNEPDCLLQSARMAEARQTGVDPGLEAYKGEAKHQNNYDSSTEGGVRDMEKFAKQINDRPGLKASYQEQGSLDDIKTELDQKNSVIAGVDAGEFYQDNTIPDFSGHAIVVTGADKGADGSWQITVNDSNQHGPNTEVSETVFKNAWNAMNNPMIIVSNSGGA